MEVSLGRVFSDMRRYDSNRDGTLSKSEAARGALDLGAQGRSDESSLFATLAAGGSDQGGLFPDFNGDGGVSFGEMASLAQSDGWGASVSPDDFQATFPDRAVAGGTSIDNSQLESIADGGYSNPFLTPQPPAFGGNPAGILLRLLLGSLLRRLLQGNDNQQALPLNPPPPPPFNPGGVFMLLFGKSNNGM